MQLIKETPKQRIYQLDFRIYRFGNSTIKDLFEADPMKLKEGWELAEDISKSINKVCISDANEFIERLTFPAFNVRNLETGEISTIWRTDNICGYNTFSIHGGDPEAVWDDQLYVRHLRMLNKEFQL